jgi:hypothetical protein
MIIVLNSGFVDLKIIGIEIAKEVGTKLQIKMVILRLNIKLIKH